MDHAPHIKCGSLVTRISGEMPKKVGAYANCEFVRTNLAFDFLVEFFG
jgi:hypothetical protein